MRLFSKKGEILNNQSKDLNIEDFKDYLSYFEYSSCKVNKTITLTNKILKELCIVDEVSNSKSWDVESFLALYWFLQRNKEIDKDYIDSRNNDKHDNRTYRTRD